MIILIESTFWWDYTITRNYLRSTYIFLITGYRNGKYLPLETIDDLVNQYNYVGFNDLCIYPQAKDMAVYKDPSSTDTKGIVAVYPGHTIQNQTGK